MTTAITNSLAATKHPTHPQDLRVPPQTVCVVGPRAHAATQGVGNLFWGDLACTKAHTAALASQPRCGPLYIGNVLHMACWHGAHYHQHSAVCL